MSSIQTFDSLFQVIDISSGTSVRADTFVRFAEPGTTNSTLQAGRRERATSNKPAEPGHWGRSDHPFSGPTYTEQSDTRRSSLVRSPPRDFNHHHHRRRRSSLFRQTRLGRVQRAERFANRLSACFPSRLSVPVPVALVASTRASFQFPELRSAPRTLAVVKKGPAHHSALNLWYPLDPRTIISRRFFPRAISSTPFASAQSIRPRRPPLSCARIPPASIVPTKTSLSTDRPTARIPTTHNQSRPSPFLPPGPHECPDNCA